MSPAILVMESLFLGLGSIVTFSLVDLYFLLLLPFPIISSLPDVNCMGVSNFIGFCCGKYFIFLSMLLAPVF